MSSEQPVDSGRLRLSRRAVDKISAMLYGEGLEQPLRFVSKRGVRAHKRSVGQCGARYQHPC